MKHVLNLFGKKNVFFGDERSDFTINKNNFPQNTLCYVNSGSVSTVKGDKTAVYLQNFILCHLVIAGNGSENIDSYECKKNEVKLFCPIYGHNKRNISWFKNSISILYIILSGDSEEAFFSYGYNKEKSTLLYSFGEERILNVITSTAFKKHLNEILHERRTSKEFSALFYYLPFITDRKEHINQWRNNVNLNPIDCSLQFLRGLSTTGTQF